VSRSARPLDHPTARVRAWRALGTAYRRAVTTGRWLVLAAWLGAAVAIGVLLPAHENSNQGFGDLLPPDSQVLQVAKRSSELFRVPVQSGTTVVVHQAGGLSLLTRADATLWALATTQDAVQRGTSPPDTLAAAIPVPTGRSDIAVAYLFASPGTGAWGEYQLALRYAAHFNNQASVSSYVTGFVPAQMAQAGYLDSRLPLFEAASVILIVSIVALAFRSLLAPLVVVGVAGVGYFVYFPLLSSLADLLGFAVPSQLEPVLVALLLGVVTDYCVLLFSAFRLELLGGAPPKEAARIALRRDGPIVAVAGLTVAGGTIALLAAPFAIFRALGPALSLTVLIGLAICLTLVPAVMTILGWRLFTVLPVRGSPTRGGIATPAHSDASPNLGIRLLTRRLPAFVALVLVVASLLLAASPLSQARLNLSFTAGLPSDDPIRVGADLLEQADLRGISAPTEVLLEQPGVINQRPALARLQGLLAQQPGVAKVYGPADLPTEDAHGLVLSENGNAARFVVIYNTDPLASEAIDEASALRDRLASLAAAAGLPDAEIAATGQTLIAAEVTQLTRESLEITVVVALIVELMILILYLRAFVAPVVLLAANALSVAAALGLTSLLFQDVLGQDGLTFYSPFAAAVLLIALGADYTVFSVGSIWEEAAHRPLVEALRAAVPRTARAITTAGVILAATFALVAIIPLATFRQIAFAMTLGLLLDTLIVRPVLTPALLTLLGRAASWPSRRTARTSTPAEDHRKDLHA
jgi:putative drug exporter of the RND superfamily